MKLSPKDSVLELLPAQVLRLRAAVGVTINCDGGTLWVTQEGFARDDFLSAGESLSIVSDGVTLVETIGNTAARLTLFVDQHRNFRMREDFSSLAAEQQPG